MKNKTEANSFVWEKTLIDQEDKNSFIQLPPLQVCSFL